ncbi:MAG: response regulator transcription factor [Planctomycetales bacterium]|nr:response regulator transcription factor [Planctomycetales bacterium]MCA9168016.1 response regulator transcription factor [Planctomycetales bacterium]
MAKLLLVEDQEALLQSIRRGLESEGHEVATATTGKEALAIATNEPVDMMILDLLLPDGTGLQTLAHLRRQGFHHPILIVTALDSVEDRIIGLDAGADDYLIKPFAFGELLARIRALLRRESVKPDTTLQFADLKVELLSRRVLYNDREIQLTRRQFELLEYLVRHQEEIVTREMLSQDVWKSTTATWTNVIEVQINQLRKRLRDIGAPSILHTVRGEGYVLRNDP